MTSYLRIVGAGVLALGVTACNSSSPAAPSAAAPSAAAPAVAEAATINAGRPADGGAVAKPGNGAKPGTMTIVGIVLQDDGEFDVLQAAVVRAGLVDTLSGPGQYTVLAPTDQAFITTLNAGTEQGAIDAVNELSIEALTNILLYHVTEGRRISKSVLAAPQYQMLNGQTLTRDTLTAAGIAATDISASNGVIHVINAVLLPQ
jgi:uncharacterized surface protein with fasciclin (FAS1) repeats